MITMTSYPEWHGTAEDKTVTRFCGTCNAGWDTLVPAGTYDALEVLNDAQDAHIASHAELLANAPVHIRTYVPLKRGNGYYAPKYSASDNGSKTLCGVPAGNDITWDEARYAKNLATVTCEDCKRVRAQRGQS